MKSNWMQKNKTAVITGAAGGIGLETAKRLANRFAVSKPIPPAAPVITAVLFFCIQFDFMFPPFF